MVEHSPSPTGMINDILSDPNAFKFSPEEPARPEIFIGHPEEEKKVERPFVREQKAEKNPSFLDALNTVDSIFGSSSAFGPPDTPEAGPPPGLRPMAPAPPKESQFFASLPGQRRPFQEQEPFRGQAWGAKSDSD